MRRCFGVWHRGCLALRLGFNKGIWAVAHRLCRLVWKILRRGARYIEYGERVTPQAQQRRVRRTARQLRSRGYNVERPETLASAAARGDLRPSG